MIERFRVQNFKALRDVTLDLTPIHVLIGPNDSGKTSILEAIAALCRSTDHSMADAFLGSWNGRSLTWRESADAVVSFDVEIGGETASPLTYSLAGQFAPSTRHFELAHEMAECSTGHHQLSSQGRSTTLVFKIAASGRSGSELDKTFATLVHGALAGVQLYRWDPRMLALPVGPDSNRQYHMESSGFGLSLCLDDILGYDRDLFADLERELHAVFPEIKSIILRRQKGYRAPVDDPQQIPMLQEVDGKGIYFKMADDGWELSAAQASDGVMLVLAYLTVLHLPKPPRVLLVEEPENGVHPSRLKEVLGILRKLVEAQEHTQVVMTTHSPYVVDQFKPEEVTLCSKEADGSVSVHRLSESAKVREQLDVFTLGEIWTAEGDEAIAKSMDPGEDGQ